MSSNAASADENKKAHEPREQTARSRSIARRTSELAVSLLSIHNRRVCANIVQIAASDDRCRPDRGDRRHHRLLRGTYTGDALCERDRAWGPTVALAKPGQLVTFDGVERRAGCRTAGRSERLGDSRESGHACAGGRNEGLFFVSRSSRSLAVGGRHDEFERRERHSIHGQLAARFEPLPSAGPVELEGIDRPVPAN